MAFQGNRVIELVLSGNQLTVTGSIPPQLGNLTTLELLELCGNELNGSIPPQLGDLTNLTDLRLGDNQPTGSIPSELGNSTNLDYLNLTLNQLSGLANLVPGSPEERGGYCP